MLFLRPSTYLQGDLKIKAAASLFQKGGNTAGFGLLTSGMPFVTSQRGDVTIISPNFRVKNPLTSYFHFYNVAF